nr:MAG TPA: hypothetical protein [Caudoviricetes sp.]
MRRIIITVLVAAVLGAALYKIGEMIVEQQDTGRPAKRMKEKNSIGEESAPYVPEQENPSGGWQERMASTFLRDSRQ